ncbi:MAG: hypothetical protein HZB57_10130 [Gammaproteobacteria bacterium]|nr:hypothetical protein [Gammaproteobacteria bacterium]
MNDNNVQYARWFRLLIVFSSVIYCALLALPSFDKNWISERGLDVLSYTGYGALFDFSESILWSFVAIWFACAIGLFFFWPWARLLFSVWMIISTGLSLTGGLQIHTSVEALLVSTSNIFDGMLLATAWFSPVQEKFLPNPPA